MSKNSKVNLTPRHDARAGAKIEQDGDISWSDMDLTNGVPECSVPVTPSPTVPVTPIPRRPESAKPGSDVTAAPASRTPVTPAPVPRRPVAAPRPGAGAPFSPELPATPIPGELAMPQQQIAAPPPRPYDQPAITSPRILELVKYYATWLAKQAEYNWQNDNSKEIESYVEEATKIVKVGKQEVAIFAP